MTLRERITIAESRRMANRALRNQEAREDWQICLGDAYEGGLNDGQKRVENFGRRGSLEYLVNCDNAHRYRGGLTALGVAFNCG